MDNINNHECYIGIWYDYQYSTLITFNELKEKISELPITVRYTIKEYLDWRCSTNLQQFSYCPFCGKKIDWKELRNLIK